MKYIQALLTLVLLTSSQRYRLRWQRTIDRVDTALDAIEASKRRIAALENGGKPKVRVV